MSRFDKKKHIVIMADSWYPNMTMSGRIAKNISDCLEKEFNCQTTIISYKNKPDEIDNDKVKYVMYHYVYWENQLLSKTKNSTGLKNKWYRFLHILKRVASSGQRNLNKYGVNTNAIGALLRTLEEINKKNPIDELIAISAPFEFQMASFEFAKKHDEIECICYQADFWIKERDNRLPDWLNEKQSKNRIALQNEIASQMKIYMQSAVYDSEEMYFDKTTANIERIYMPLLVDRTNSTKTENMQYGEQNDADVKQTLGQDGTRFLYAGTLNFEERDPRLMLDAMLEASKHCKLRFDIFHMGNCDSHIENQAKANPDIIINHGSAPSSIVDETQKSADILVILSTKSGGHIAGKNFECISSCKRIVYFYFKEDDINAKFLEKYPYALTLNVNQLSKEQCAEEIIKLIDMKVDNAFCFEDVKKMYGEYTPSLVCKQLIG